jgi:hypothetical protein
MIDRKSLNYTETALLRTIIPGHSDTGWKVMTYKGNPEEGKCSIMKTPPTAGNQI